KVEKTSIRMRGLMPCACGTEPLLHGQVRWWQGSDGLTVGLADVERRTLIPHPDGVVSLAALVGDIVRRRIEIEVPDRRVTGRRRSRAFDLREDVVDRKPARVDLDSAKDAVPDLVPRRPRRIAPCERRRRR